MTLRSILTGLFLTIFIAALTPYNDNISHNTYLIGNHLPLIAVAVIAVFCLLINPLLGRRRFSTAEMVVALGMMLISCALPSSGFFRYFSATLVDPVYFARDIPWYHDYLAAMPRWLLPSQDPHAPIVEHFYKGIDPVTGSLASTWRPWVVPWISWACFFVPLFSAVILFSALMRKQWVVHERLAYPLASIPLAMLEAPAPGHRFNTLWRSRWLWLGVAIPLVIHLLNGSAIFYPNVPTLPLTYDVSGAFTDPPWNQLTGYIKSATIYFSVVGVTFFVPLEIAFSLWFFFLLYQFAMIYLNTAGIQVTGENQLYQGMGAFVAYGIMLLWIARHHFAEIARNLFKPRAPDEFLSYGAGVLALALCILASAAFLATALGNVLNPFNWALGIFIVAAILFYGMVLTRIVIDAGVLLIQVPAGAEPLQLLGFLFQGHSKLLAARQWMVASFSLRLALTDQRETLMPYAADTLRLGAQIKSPRKPRFLALLALALLLCALVSGATHHVLSYSHGRQDFDDGFGPYWFPHITLDQARQNAEPDISPPKINRPLNVLAGAAAITVIGVLRLTFVSFPLHPIGLLMLNNWAIGKIWYSVFISSVLKWMILRWGGASLYRQTKPFFIGLLVGESLAGVFWIIVGLITPWPSLGGAYQVMMH